MEQYILNAEGKVVPEPDLLRWALWFGNMENRKVAQDDVGEANVSTIFLGLNHQHGDGPPIVWETMVFGGQMDKETNRCSGNREQAEAMHADMVERVRAIEALTAESHTEL